jgi:hypothetical protein
MKINDLGKLNKVDEGVLKDVIKVEIKDEQQKILNQIYQ